MNNGVNALDGFDGIVGSANSIVNGTLSPALQATLVAIAALNAAGPGGVWPPPTDGYIAQLQAAVAAGNATTAAIASKLASLSSAIDNTLHSSSSNPLDVHTLGTRVFQGGVTALAVFLGFVAFSLFGLRGTKCGACFFRGFDACGLVLSVLLVCIFAGLFMAISLVGGRRGRMRCGGCGWGEGARGYRLREGCSGVNAT